MHSPPPQTFCCCLFCENQEFSGAARRLISPKTIVPLCFFTVKSVTKFCRYGEMGKWCNLQHIDLHDLLDVLTMGFLLSIISIIRILVFSVGI